MKKKIETPETVAENKAKRPANTTITRNIYDLNDLTGNVYETVALLTKRANQLAIEEKKELHSKINEFATSFDTMDDIYENREQIEVVRHYEQMPKPVLVATQEYLNGELNYRNPAKEDQTEKKMEAAENAILGK